MGTCLSKFGAKDSCLPVIHHVKVSSLWKGGHVSPALCYSLLASGGPDAGPSEDSSEAGVRAILSGPSSPATCGKGSPRSDSVFLLVARSLL